MTDNAFDILVPDAMKYLAAKQIGGGVYFDIPGSNNVAFLRIMKGYSHPTEVCFKIDVAPQGSNQATGYFFHFADGLEGLKQYLLDPHNAGPVKKAIRELNEAVNNRDG